ncbi:hypothetical protein [Chondrinema litorale]|uniref:hypothetical protein n=1 Tax=Chondrinema litorale TaxID=2994555 RepID=UPI002542BB33|nr:hypothetical protein [Chondrinema litorale]UZR99250.1 hypothetical protein OQ292_35295 [Chondrinema litorale]
MNWKSTLHLVIVFITGFVFCSQIAVAQQAQPTFNEHIAPIIFNNCTPCHHENGTAPFALETYKDVSKRASFIKHVIETRYMPPWKADPHYRSFANEKTLTDEEINAIKNWVAQGAVKGKGKPKADLPEFKSGSQLSRTPDLVLKMREPFIIPGNNEQTYICYKIPFELEEEKFVQGVEFVPGNKKLVHHASYQVLGVADDVDIYNSKDYFVFGDDDYIDDQHDYRFFNLYTESGTAPKEMFHNGWLPGNSPQQYPEGVGFKMPKRGIFMIRNLHYAPSPVEAEDQSEIRIYFTDKPVSRTIQFITFQPTGLDYSKENIIPADTVVKYEMNIKVGQTLSLISINPHMHLLGKNFKAFALTPQKDTIPLVNIPDWDFQWQEFYQYKNLLKLPAGSVVHAEAIFDNTNNNPNNPSYPPKDTFFERGMDDEDEMMRLTFLYLPYQSGDENKSLNKWKDDVSMGK